MNTMNDLEVIINNKRYTISGYESEEYLQKIASHINSKYAQFRTHENYNHMDSEIRNVLMQINLADDYYKAIRQKSDLEAELERKEKELFEVKHLLVEMQAQNDDLTKQLADCNHNYNEAQRRIIQLESNKSSN
ncbi:MAG: cell division protein ZapA [Lachnospiraceae bacterium]|jgi:cell division protein ZapA|nr:cell division protein ZapA [Lachnospiraceae bacterium]MCX4318069.1 cell division protein ZapA [Lachnospiraceae bacterium]